MQELVVLCLAVVAAWWVGLDFLQLGLRKCFLGAVGSGLLYGVLQGIFRISGMRAAWFLHCLIGSLAVLLLLLFWLPQRRREAALAFCIASGTEFALLTASRALFQEKWPMSLLAMLAVEMVFLLPDLLLRPWFPAPGWLEGMQPATQPDALPLSKRHVYAIGGGILLFPVLVSVFSAWPYAKGAIQILAVAFISLWGGVALLMVIAAYGQEHGEALAERQYRSEMLEFMNVIRSQRHDYNFHVQTIAELMQQGQIEECRTYVSELERDTVQMNALLPLSDPAIGAMIYQFQLKAAKAGIRLQVEIQNDLSQIATNVYETNKILSNLLQNALDETSGHRDKSFGIQLQILKRGEYCVIRVSNQLEDNDLSPEKLEGFYRQGYTTKAGHDGVGLSSIRTLAARYRGTVYTQLDGSIISFIAKIPMHYSAGTGFAARRDVP